MRALLLCLPVAMAVAFAAAPALAQDGGGMLERLKMADANGDGAITRAEMRATREQAFRRLDGNNDGFVTAEERAQIAAAAQTKGKGKRGGQGGERGVEQMDTNNDGKISREEFLNGPTRGFDRLDANNNDVIEAAELETARAMMARRKQVTP